MSHTELRDLLILLLRFEEEVDAETEPQGPFTRHIFKACMRIPAGHEDLIGDPTDLENLHEGL